ncbi:peptide chain release factor N(5)-glutamine methyltransferase [Terricaulis sp.]|uniref:peptide chain release factor N(5)-glutamine methyltransferase n=1 Tax=Terricaulis sp. TaxID=2768686 RepID=UPI003784A1EF
MSETLVSLWQRSRDALIAAGVDSPVLDARLLLEAGAGVSRTDIVTDPRRELTAAQVAAVEALIARRAKREPVSHITGRKAFWTLDLAVSAAVLTPRPETEFVVDAALKALPPSRPARVLDLGVGSGAILLAVLAERDLASGIGLDLSPDALAVARGNAAALKLDNRVEFHLGGWDAPIAERFDLVLSNPPYIPTAEIDTLAPEVAVHEPRLALDGGRDGLDAYRAITARLPALLKPGGVFAFEVGKGQAPAVEALAGAQGLSLDAAALDLAGIARVVSGRLPD